jgi:acetylornithine deacetylase
MDNQELYQEAAALLKELISIQSFSREEDKTADAIAFFLERHGVAQVHRKLNNVWAFNKHYNPQRPTLTPRHC